MSDAYSWALRQRVGHGGRKSVLLFMATHATFKSAVADMSSSLIAETLEYSDSSIRKWLTDLVEMGLVEKLPQYRADGFQMANLYRLNVRGSWVEDEDPEADQSKPASIVAERASEPEPAPIPKRSDSRSLKPVSFEARCLEIYLDVRPDNWVAHSKITGRAKAQLSKLQSHFGAKALTAFRHALLYARDQKFWTDPKNTFSLSNIGSNDKLIEMAEKYQMALQQQEERLFNGPMTASKAKEIIEKYPDKPVTEQMWAVLNDDDKLATIKVGQTRRHEIHGPVLVNGIEGNKVICQKGATHHESHIRYFNHEVLEQQITVQATEKKEAERNVSPLRSRFQNILSH